MPDSPPLSGLTKHVPATRSRAMSEHGARRIVARFAFLLNRHFLIALSGCSVYVTHARRWLQGHTESSFLNSPRRLHRPITTLPSGVTGEAAGCSTHKKGRTGHRRGGGCRDTGEDAACMRCPLDSVSLAWRPMQGHRMQARNRCPWQIPIVTRVCSASGAVQTPSFLVLNSKIALVNPSETAPTF